MSKGKAPKTPDPVIVAQAQADANLETARATAGLNRYDQTTPFGSVSWSQDPNNPHNYTSTTTYDPVTQAIIDKTKTGVEGLTDRAYETLGQQLPEAPTVAPGQQYAEDLLTSVGDYLPPSTDFVQSALDRVPKVNDVFSSSLSNFQDTVRQPFNFESAPAMPLVPTAPSVPIANEDTRNSIANSLYDRAVSRLDPRYTQASNDLDARLAAQGITQGTGAYNREKDNLARDRNDAYNIAMNTANLSGIDAMTNLFGMGKDTFGMGMDANKATFDMGMATIQQGVAETQAIRDQASREAAVASGLAGGATDNATNAMMANIANTAAIPQIAGNVLANTTQGFNNETQGMINQNNQRNQSINELGNVSNIYGNNIPNLQPGIAGDTQVSQTPIADSVYNSYQGDMNKYAGQVGSSNNLVSGLAGLGGMAMMAPAGTMAGIGSGIASGLGGLMVF